MPHERRIRAIRLLLRRYLYRELHVVRGPYARSYKSVQRQVLESADVQKFIQTEAIQRGVSEATLRKAAAKSFFAFALFSYRAVSVAAWGCRVLWDRIYSGVDIREEDLGADSHRHPKRHAHITALPSIPSGLFAPLVVFLKRALCCPMWWPVKTAFFQ